MRSKLNPDGAKIRILRIQRGWTQEQLAEIAGVSCRTIQRAETANCAAFETLRAIAGAYETDFDQLLKHQADRNSDHEPRIADPAGISGSAPEIELNPTAPLKAARRGVWAIPLLSVSTLVLGLVSGVILTTHLHTRGKSHSSEPPNTAMVSQAAKMLPDRTPPVTAAQPVKPVIKAPSQSGITAAPNHPEIIAESLLSSSPAEQPSETTITADSGSRDIIQPSQSSASLDLPPHSHTLLSEPGISGAIAPSGELPVFSGNRPSDEPDPGAVRQAVDLAARKTGAFVSRIGTSVRRVF